MDKGSGRRMSAGCWERRDNGQGGPELNQAGRRVGDESEGKKNFLCGGKTEGGGGGTAETTPIKPPGGIMTSGRSRAAYARGAGGVKKE